MMKKNYLFVIILSMFSWAACSDDDNGGMLGPEPEKPGVNTKVKISLTQGAGLTKRTKAPAGIEQPTTEEMEIGIVTIYVFNGGGVLEKIVPVTLGGSDMSEVIEATTGPHFFYAVVNGEYMMPDVYEGITTRSTFEQLDIQLFGVEDITTSISDGGDGFLMSSIGSPEPIELEVATEDEANSGIKNHIKIPVGRAAAKVNLKMNASAANQIGGLLTDVVYKVKVMPNTSHIVPYYQEGIFKASFHFDDYDPFNYMENWSYVPEEEPSYSVENSSWTPLKGNINYLVIKGIFTPDVNVWKNADGSPVGSQPAKGTSFWRIANMHADGYPDTFEPDYYAASPTISLQPDQQIIAYPGGECYYPFWVFDKSAAIGDPARYNMERNKYYYVSVISVNGAGVPNEDEVVPDPLSPLLESTWLKTEIEIKDWTVIDVEGGI